jgi:hypothetical protein
MSNDGDQKKCAPSAHRRIARHELPNTVVVADQRGDRVGDVIRDTR